MSHSVRGGKLFRGISPILRGFSGMEKILSFFILPFVFIFSHDIIRALTGISVRGYSVKHSFFDN